MTDIGADHLQIRGGVLISYALSTAGTLLHVSQVPSGKSCECRCVACHRPMVAKKGEIRVHHFAHAHEVGCIGALETVLHRLAKEILRDARDFVVPAYRWNRQQAVGERLIVMDRQLFGGGRIRIDAIEIESQRFQGVKPDAVIDWTSPVGRRKRILIEIAVRHRVDGEKLSKLQQLGLPALEVRMTPEQACQPREEVREILLYSVVGKHWLYHPAEVKAQRLFEREVTRAEDELRRKRAERSAEARAQIRRMKAALSLSRSDKTQITMEQFLEC